METLLSVYKFDDFTTNLIIIAVLLFTAMDVYSLYDVWTSKKFIVIKVLQTVFEVAKISILLLLIMTVLF